MLAKQRKPRYVIENLNSLYFQAEYASNGSSNTVLPGLIRMLRDHPFHPSLSAY